MKRLLFVLVVFVPSIAFAQSSVASVTDRFFEAVESKNATRLNEVLSKNATVKVRWAPGGKDLILGRDGRDLGFTIKTFENCTRARQRLLAPNGSINEMDCSSKLFQGQFVAFLDVIDGKVSKVFVVPRSDVPLPGVPAAKGGS